MTAPRPPLRLGPRKRLARWLRWVASKLDDQRRPPGRAHLSAVPGGSSAGVALPPGQLTINEAPPAWPEGEIVRRRGHGASEGDYLL